MSDKPQEALVEDLLGKTRQAPLTMADWLRDSLKTTNIIENPTAS